MPKKYKKGSAWKRGHWDKWGFWRRVGHVLAVPAGLICIISMLAFTAYIFLIYFGLLGFLMTVRDEILLEFAHWLFD